MQNKKIVLCRPWGGINDMFVQIEKCMKYSRDHNRTMYLDTSKSGLLDVMDNYFESHVSINYGLPKIPNNATAFPEEITTQGIDYDVIWSSSSDNYAFKSTGNPITFDFSKDYKEDFLIHEQCGGGFIPINALESFTLRPELQKKIGSLIDSLGVYDAIHIRNTDHKTDYTKFFAEVDLTKSQKLILCSDDYSCQQYVKKLFGNRVIIINHAPNTDGKSLHENKSLERLPINVAALTDLLLLSCSKRIYYTNLDRGGLSGFTSLALALQANFLAINNLLGRH